MGLTFRNPVLTESLRLDVPLEFDFVVSLVVWTVRLNVYAGDWVHGLEMHRNNAAWKLVTLYRWALIGWMLSNSD